MEMVIQSLRKVDALWEAYEDASDPEIKSKDTIEMKVNITLTLDPNIIAWLSRNAVEEGRTISNFVNQHFAVEVDRVRAELNQRNENEGEIHRDTK